MKILFTISLFAIALYGCDSAEQNKKIREWKHELRKFNVGNSQRGASGWYFLVMGGYTGASNEAKVRFYYKDYQGEYSFMETTLDRVNIKIENTPKPYATFSDAYHTELTRVVIHCREQDFQPEININQLR